MSGKPFAGLAALCALASFSAHAAEIPAGEIDGVVNDALGQPLAAARIEVKNRNGAVLAITHSDSNGHFHFTHLASGVYALIATLTDYRQGTDIVWLAGTQGKTSRLTLASTHALRLRVAVQQASPPRNGVSLDNGGASSYHISSKDIQQMPLGTDTSFNQLLLQAPGVAQDSFGQIHVRGDHGDLQYRINGVLLPEAISGFGQTLDSRFIDSVNLLTGTLSAQYGYRTAGVVDIHTKTGAFDQGGSVEIGGGNHNTAESSAQLQGHSGNFSYYLDASGLQNSLGIENPMPTFNAVHDASTQNNGFGYLSWTISDTLRASAMFGAADSRFQIPDLYGQTPLYSLSGVNTMPSQALNEQQHETTRYGLLALQGTLGSQYDYQLSAFSRYSRVLFGPDIPGDLIYTGVASQVLRTALENGLEADFDARISPSHTLRTGIYISSEQADAFNNLLAFPANAAGQQTSTVPLAQSQYSSLPMNLFGVYVQDRWQATQRLTIDYGLRFDQVDAYTSGHQMSPRLGAVYQWSPATTLHAGYAHYYTPPPDELISGQLVAGAQSTTNAQPGGTLNSPVRSQSSDDFDLGIDQRLNPYWNVGMDGYYKQVTNLLDEGQFGSALLYTPFNYAQGMIYGVEWTASYRRDTTSVWFNLANSTAMGRNIISSQYNFSPAELSYIANNWVHLDHDQTWTASSGVSWFARDITWSADLLYGSGLRSGFANTSHLPGYMQVNVGALRTLKLPRVGRLDARLSIVNLLNTSYEIRDGTGIGVGAPQYGPTRTVILSLTKPF